MEKNLQANELVIQTVSLQFFNLIYKNVIKIATYPIDASFWVGPTRKTIGSFDQQEFTIWINNSATREKQKYNDKFSKRRNWK